MILEGLSMRRVGYGPEKGQMQGTATFQGTSGAVIINLDGDKCRQILTVCAIQIVDTAKQVARDLCTQEVIGQAAISRDAE